MTSNSLKNEKEWIYIVVYLQASIFLLTWATQATLRSSEHANIHTYKSYNLLVLTVNFERLVSSSRPITAFLYSASLNKIKANIIGRWRYSDYRGENLLHERVHMLRQAFEPFLDKENMYALVVDWYAFKDILKSYVQLSAYAII